MKKPTILILIAVVTFMSSCSPKAVIGTVTLTQAAPAETLLPSVSATSRPTDIPHTQMATPTLEPTATSTPTPVTEIIGQVGGASRAVASQGIYVYLGQGARMAVVDVSDPANPVQVGQTRILPSYVGTIAADGDYAYLTCFNDGNLWIFDISNPLAPTEISSILLGGYPISIDIVGETAYVGHTAGFYILDVSNRTTPSLIGTYDQGGYVTDVSVSDTLAFVASEKTITVVDVSNSTSPIQRGTYAAPEYILDTAVAENYVFLNNGWNMLVLDVSDSFNPVLAGTARLPRRQWAQPWLIEVYGDTAYVCGNELDIIDISDPANPSPLVHFTQGAEAISIGSDMLYMAIYSGGMNIVSISNPAQPQDVGEYRPLGTPRTLAISDKALFVSDDAGLHIFDVSNPASPLEKGFLSMPKSNPQTWIEDIVFGGHYAYLALPNVGLEILDLTDPFQPVEVSITRLGIYTGEGIAVAEPYAYILGYGNLKVVDISNPSAPGIKGGLNLRVSEAFGGRKIAAVGSYIYIADGKNGLTIVDVSKPNAPALVSAYDTPGDVNDLVVEGDYAYLAERQDDQTGGGGLRIIDISEPLNPREVGAYDQYSYYGPSAGGLAISGDTAYLADWYMGLQIIDITDPGNLFIADNFEGNGTYATDVVVSNGYAYVAWNSRGLMILRSMREEQRSSEAVVLPVGLSPTQTILPPTLTATPLSNLTATPKPDKSAGSASWKSLPPTSGLPVRGMQAVYDSSRNVVVLFGGTDGANKFLNQTWEFDGKTWKQIKTGHTPVRRLWFGMAYDARRKVVVLFGGRANDRGTLLEDTWEYDGKDWTRIDTAGLPGKRGDGPGMVYDTCRGRIILFGGKANSGATQTWEYDGRAWVQVKTTQSPLARELTAMVFDSNRCKAVLFGGGKDGKGLNDTWEYDGINWEKITSSQIPTGRWGHAMAYNAISRHVVLFGGYANNTYLKDTWIYDGANWQKVTTARTPSAREQHAMVFSWSTGQILMIGGYGSNGNWAFAEGVLQSATPTATSTSSACAGGWTRLSIGRYATVTSDNNVSNYVRSEPKKADNVIGSLGPGMVLKIMEGPICADGLVFWKVKNDTIPGGEGWTAEGDGTEYWLKPYP